MLKIKMKQIIKNNKKKSNKKKNKRKKNFRRNLKNLILSKLIKWYFFF